MSGYDKFFKDAEKANGLSTGHASRKSPSNASTKKAARSKSPLKTSFPLKAPSQKSERHGSAEDRLRQEMAERSRARRQTSMRKRQAFPVVPAIIAITSIVFCAIGFFKPDLADQVLSHIEIGAFAKANAEPAKGGAAKAEAKAAEAKSPESKSGEAKSAEAKVGTGADVATASDQKLPSDFRSWSDEELSFFNKLNDRKKELDLREADLNKLDEELQKQKAELDQKIKQLEAMRGDISKTLQTRVSVDQEKVGKLVQFYSTMKPQQAAKVIESINEDLAVEVMDKMKKKDAAAIMDALKPEKARRLSELLTGYQRTPASEATEKTE